jgi:3-oxoadipate enol-lactonase
MAWIDVGETVLRYELAGAGTTTLLLIHEMGGTLESWDYLLPLLAPHYRIVRYDLRGAGMSEKPRQILSMNDLGRDAVALLDAVGVTEPVSPVGCAVGGAVALHLASRYPLRFGAAVAMSPATGVSAERRQTVNARADRLEHEGTRAIVEDGLARGYPPPLRGDAERFARTRAQRLSADPFAFAAMMRMLANLDMRPDLERITRPVLLLAGSFDQDRPPEGVAALGKLISTATVRVLEAGHFMAIQRPDLVAAEIDAFLDRKLR